MKRAFKQAFKPKTLFIVSSMRQLKNKNEHMKRARQVAIDSQGNVYVRVPSDN